MELKRMFLGFLLLAPALATGCVRMRPLDDVRSDLATGQVLTIGEQSVYVERRGSGEPVVLVHGFGASTYSWRKVIPELARGHDVIALDLSGFGLTERTKDPRAYTREGQIELILNALDSFGIESAHFIGHSYGGALTMTLVARQPERVRSMVLVDAAEPDYPIKRRRRITSAGPFTWFYVRGVGLRRGRVEKLFHRVYYDTEQITDELIDAYLDRLRIEGTVRAFRNLTRPRKDAELGTVRYAELDVPALVVWGAEDTVVTAEKGEGYARQLPDSRFVSIAQSGHSPMEEQPEEFLAHVLPFLDEMTRSAKVDTDDPVTVEHHP